MKKQLTSLALTLGASVMLGLPVIAASAEAEAGGAVAAVSGGLDGVQVATGLHWCKAQQSYRAIGDNKVWVYLESCQPASGGLGGWWWCNDNECEKTFIAAAASAHYVGLEFPNTTSFNVVRLYKY